FLLLSLEKRKNQKGHPGRQNEKTFKKYRKKLQKWAELNPENHNGKYLLIEALDRSVNNQQQNAAKLYDEAIEHAKEKHNLLLEALGNYLAADYYSANKKIAGIYARDACRLFNEWGSEKTANRIGMLFEINDDFAVSETAVAGTAGEIPDNTGPERETSFEQRLQGCQKELEKMELEAAYQYFLKTVCTEAGADCGAILLEEEDQVKLKYMWQDGKEGFRYPAGIDMEQVEHLPKKVLRYASRTYEEVIIETRPAEGIFAGDDYIRDREGISIICLPLKYKDIFAGLIYLESKINHCFDYEIVGYIKRLSFYLVARQVLEREPEKSGKVFTNDTVNDQLTDREAEVLYYMAEAMSNKKIGEKLHISSSTVKTHTKSIYGKLEVSSRVQAVIKAKALKLV
ncbi:MAG: LuxR C-terminal-related transcriptional regulator, partial [Bacillota bacterium]